MNCFSDKNNDIGDNIHLGNRGVVSQMLCIVVAAFVLFNFAMYDYVTVSHQKLVSQRINDLACSSIMASFDETFEKYYGLYCLDTEKTDVYLTRYYEIINEERANLLSVFSDKKNYDGFYVPERNVTAYSVAYSDSILSKPVLKSELYDLMKYKSVGNFVEFIMDKITALAGIQKETEAYEYLEKFDDKFEIITNMQKEFEPLLNGTEGINGSGVNGFKESEIVLNLSLKINDILSVCPDGITVSDREVIKALLASVNVIMIPASTYNLFCSRALDTGRKLESLCEEAEELLDKAEDAETGSGVLESVASGAFGTVESRRSKLESCGDFGEICAKIQGNIDALAYAVNSKYRLEAFIEKNGYVESEILKDTLGAIKTAYESYKEVRQGEIHEVTKVSANIKDLFNKAVDAVGVFFNFIPPQSTEIDKDLYKKIPSQREGIAETESFGKKITFDLSGTLISDSFSAFADEIEKSAGNTSIADWYFIDDYLMTYFNSALDNTNKGSLSYLNGELEYIIFGSRKDKTNFISAVASISALRLILNISHILRDEEKMKEIRSVSDHPAVIGILVFAWGLFETAFDISNLRNGEKIPFIKGDDDWNCDLNGAKRYVESTVGDVQEDGKENITSMSYRDYLRLFLVFVPYNTKLARLQDLLELNHYKQIGIYKPLDIFAAGISLESEISVDTLLFRGIGGLRSARWRVVSNGKY